MFYLLQNNKCEIILNIHFGDSVVTTRSETYYNI